MMPLHFIIIFYQGKVSSVALLCSTTLPFDDLALKASNALASVMTWSSSIVFVVP